MKLEWMNHTGFVVNDMERSLAFYHDLLGLEIERDAILEGKFISQVVGFPNTKLRGVYLGLGDMRHSLELIQYLNPPGYRSASIERNAIGASHLGIIVDNVEVFYQKLSQNGCQFVNPPAFRDSPYPWARKACYLSDPDGNWLEAIERSPAPTGSTQV